MKIGVVTFWQTGDNYGQLLQCWALQKYLLGQGHEPFLIRYDLSCQRLSKLGMIRKEGIITFLRDKFILRDEIARNKALRKRNAVRNRARDFDSFRREHLRMSAQSYGSLRELQDNPPPCDVLITGSDQVWALPLDEEKSEAFFLNFGGREVFRASYAASFSRSDYPQKDLPKLRDMLSRFDAISVRERSGIPILRQAGAEGVAVVDPVLLLQARDYGELLPDGAPGDVDDPSDRPGNPAYLYLYSVNVSSADEMDWGRLSAFAVSNGLEVRASFASGRVPGDEIFPDIPATDGIGNLHVRYEYPSVGQWIASIRDAAVMATSSFHGVAFSILMHTPFIYFPLEGVNADGNVRVTDLLEELGLLRCVWQKDMDFRSVSAVDWIEVDRKLSVLRDRSEVFLDKLGERSPLSESKS